MKTLNNIILVSLVIGLTFGLGSCKKRRLNRSTVTSQDNAIAEMAFNDAFKVTEDAMKENGLEKSGASLSSIYNNCATVTLNPPVGDTTFPKTLTIDFGSTNCTDAYGVARRGKVIATTTGYYRDAGTVVTITTQDYYVNDYKVEGVKTVTNNGLNSNGQTYFTIDISNATITFPDGDIVTYESNRVRTWVVGESTNFLNNGLNGMLDDEYDITGTASGINREGRAYTMTITSPLRAAILCRWIKQGTVEIQPEDLHLRTVDFGSGDCDREATVTINNKVYNFNMY